MLEWSPRPRMDYTAKDEEGNLVGIGVHPIFEVMPEVWNLFWLSSETVDNLLGWQGDPLDAPQESTILPHCVGMAMQRLSNNHPLHELLTNLRPRTFLDTIVQDQNYPNLLLPAIFGGVWLGLARRRADLYVPPAGASIQHIQFGQ